MKRPVESFNLYTWNILVWSLLGKWAPSKSTQSAEIALQQDFYCTFSILHIDFTFTLKHEINTFKVCSKGFIKRYNCQTFVVSSFTWPKVLSRQLPSGCGVAVGMTSIAPTMTEVSVTLPQLNTSSRALMSVSRGLPMICRLPIAESTRMPCKPAWLLLFGFWSCGPNLKANLKTLLPAGRA